MPLKLSDIREPLVPPYFFNFFSVPPDRGEEIAQSTDSLLVLAQALFNFVILLGLYLHHGGQYGILSQWLLL